MALLRYCKVQNHRFRFTRESWCVHSVPPDIFLQEAQERLCSLVGVEVAADEATHPTKRAEPKGATPEGSPIGGDATLNELQNGGMASVGRV